jgi:hypothetical protein
VLLVCRLAQVFTITVPAEQEAAARQLVLSMSPNARLTYSVGGTLKFELPTSEVRTAAGMTARAHPRWWSPAFCPILHQGFAFSLPLPIGIWTSHSCNGAGQLWGFENLALAWRFALASLCFGNKASCKSTSPTMVWRVSPGSQIQAFNNSLTHIGLH